MSSTRWAGDGRRRLMAESKHSAHSGAHGCCGSHGAHGEGTPPGLAVDPVCGMTVDPQKTAHHAAYAGHEWHSCSAGCRQKFVGDPDHYLNKSAHRFADAPPGTTWTCPRHHHTRQDHTGALQFSTMALGQETSTAAT